jgi:hypothetical protein
MNSSFVIWQNILERITSKPDLENIILGTGAIARDLQTKLRLMNLKSSFLVGDREDSTEGIVHYKRLSEVADDKNFRFICAFDTEEYALIAPVQSAVFKLLGVATYNHPRMFFSEYNRNTVMHELDSCTYQFDANIHDIALKSGLPYEMFGTTCFDAFNIHILGGSTASSIFSISQYSWARFLYERLNRSGFKVVVYNWAKAAESPADCLLEFLRDSVFHKADLVVLYSSGMTSSSLNVTTNNILSIRTLSGVRQFNRGLRESYQNPTSNGLNFDLSESEIFDIQCCVFNALGKMFGFDFWSVVPPSGDLLPEKQARRLLGLSPGYLARKRSTKDGFLAKAAEYCVKDYSDTFAEVGEIFDMFADISHLTNEANELVAQRFTDDILRTFGNREITNELGDGVEWRGY